MKGRIEGVEEGGRGMEKERREQNGRGRSGGKSEGKVKKRGKGDGRR